MQKEFRPPGIRHPYYDPDSAGIAPAPSFKEQTHGQQGQEEGIQGQEAPTQTGNLPRLIRRTRSKFPPKGKRPALLTAGVDAAK
ncbi:hypothetical protein [Azospira sp. I09]|jgi:hypothetical protein|uniref:hypothetical protein n=1 Tax=Azospira sp. I09 TaxID=1765049 RepID=UPI001562B8AF|nr:hypothetical protein [Azospira sp. I09]